MNHVSLQRHNHIGVLSTKSAIVGEKLEWYIQKRLDQKYRCHANWDELQRRL